MLRKYHRRLVISNLIIIIVFGLIAVITWYLSLRKIGILNVLPSYYTEDMLIILSIIGIIKTIIHLWQLEDYHELV